MLYTLLVVTVAFVLFRADSFQQGGWFIAQMFTGWHFNYASVELAMRQLTPLFVATFCVAVLAATPLKGLIQAKLQTASAGAVAAAEVASYVVAFVLLLLCLLSLSGGGYNPFIYFRF